MWQGSGEDKQIEIVRERERMKKRQSSAGGGFANVPALKPHISWRDSQAQGEREGVQTISANTNMGNGSKMEFTRARCWAGVAKKTASPNQTDLNGNRRERKHIPASVNRAFDDPGSQSESCNRQEGLHAEE